MSGSWLVSFHGGNDDTSINNLGVFSGPNAAASPFYALGPSAEPGPHPGAMPALRELRAFLPSPDGAALYVVNAYDAFSQVLTFARDATEDAAYVFVSGLSDKKLRHPFDIVVGWDGALYVSNQDDETNAIVFFTPGGQTVATFSTANVSAARGLAFDGTYLYLADAGSHTLSAYAASGAGRPEYQFTVDQPVHLLYDGQRHLYVGSEHGNSILTYDTLNPTQNPRLLVSGGTPALDHTGGLALATEAGSTTLYVASREAFQVLAYPLTFSQAGDPTWDGHSVTVFLDTRCLPDNPEFISYVA